MNTDEQCGCLSVELTDENITNCTVIYYNCCVSAYFDKLKCKSLTNQWPFIKTLKGKQ